MPRKLLVVLATICALLLSGALFLSSAAARTSPRAATSAALRIVRLERARELLRRVHFTQPHPVTIGVLPKIIGGSNAAQGTYGFMAFVAYFDRAGNLAFTCTGTVIAPNVVLTAGHCAVDETTGAPLDPAGFAVVTGSVDWTNTTLRQVIPVSQAIVNPAYDPVTDTSDAALLVLSTPTSAPAIPLATTGDAYLETGGTPAVIAGWGETYYDDPALQTDLEWAPTVIQNPDHCSQYDPYFDASSELCAVDPPDDTTGTCNGDSGGPLAVIGPTGQYIEIGITTHGPPDCDTYTADDFTGIIPLQAWAAGWIQAVAPPSSPAPVSPPTTTTPPPSQSPSSTLPTLTLSAAKRYVRQTLAGALKRTFKSGYQYTARCSRSSQTRFKCGVTFSSGPNDYYGTVTVYLIQSPSGLVEWSDKYTIHWVDSQCYFHSGHPSRCAVHTRRGTW